MSAYVTIEQLTAKLPLAHLTDAFDDDKDGAVDQDVVDAALEAASRDVDSYLERRYTVPFTTVPALVGKAALLFALETVYDRRGAALPEALAQQIKDVRALLTEIGNGDQPLTPDETPTTGGVGAAITECAQVNTTLA